MNQISNYSAGTKYPNTSESDSQACVWHIVEGIGPDGTRLAIEIYATDPMDAITRAQQRPLDRWKPA